MSKEKRDKKLNEEFGVLSDSEIEQCNDLQKALELINKEQVVTEVDVINAKKFVVESNKDLTDLKPKDMEEKTDLELDMISNQADQAFTDLMDIALNSSGKACGDIAGAAQAFLTIKLNAKLSKTELKLKKMKQELDARKLELSTKKGEPSIDDSYTDGDIIVIDKTV